MSEWIKCSERLPEFEHGAGYVLVACTSGYVTVSFFSKLRSFGKITGKSYSRSCQGKNSGYFEISHQYGYVITHWMPLPAAPEDV